MRDVVVEKRKFPSRPVMSWHAEVLGHDSYGHWLYAPPGTVRTPIGGPPRDIPAVQLLPDAQWWTVWFWAAPKSPWLAADVCTPPRFDAGAWHYDDLELDVVGNSDGTVVVMDEDEFEHARDEVPYPDTVVDAALAARDDLVRMIRAGAEPFGTRGWSLARDPEGWSS